MSNAEFYFEIAKFAIPLLMMLIAWAWRVELRLSNHASLIEKINETLGKVGATLDEWNDVKNDRGERLMRLETKIDLLLTNRQMARLMSFSREDEK